MFTIIKCKNDCLLEKVVLHSCLFTRETIGHMKSIHKHPIKKRDATDHNQKVISLDHP